MRTVDVAQYNRPAVIQRSVSVAAWTKAGWFYVTDYADNDLPFLQTLPGTRITPTHILVPLNAVAALPDRFKVVFDPGRLTEAPATTAAAVDTVPLKIGPSQYPGAAEVTAIPQYQRVGAAHLRQPVGAILGDGLGLGKSIQAILAAHVSGYRRVLVIAPLTARGVWCGEYSDARRRFGLVIWPLAGVKDADFDGPTLATHPDFTLSLGRLWVFCHYDILAAWFPYISQRFRPECVIVDEAHKMYGHKTTRAKQAMAICQLACVQSRFVLTATQVRKNRTNLYPLLECAQPGAFGKFFTYAPAYAGAVKGEYGMHYGDAAYDYLEKQGEDPDEVLNIRDEELDARLSLILLRRGDEVQADLPAITRQVIDVEIDPDASAAYVNAERDVRRFLRETQGQEITAGSEQLVQVTALCTLLSNAKIPATVDLVLDALEGTDKVVVFTWYTESAASIVNAVKGEIAGRGKAGFAGDKLDDVLVLGPTSGATSAKTREARAAKFRSHPGRALFVATLGSASESINDLIGANVGITHDLYWDPTPLIQSEGRLRRTGQTRPVHWKYPRVVGTIEDRIVEKLLRAAQEIVKGHGGAGASDLTAALAGTARPAAEDALQSLVADLLAIEGTA